MPPSPVIVLAGGLVVGIIFWILSQKPQKRKKELPKPKVGLVDRIYEPKTSSEQTLRSPLAPDPDPIFEKSNRPSLYSVDNYRGPMGVMVPYGTIRKEYIPWTMQSMTEAPFGIPRRALSTMPRPGSLPSSLDPYVPEGRFPLGYSGFVTSVGVPVGTEVATRWSKVGLLVSLNETDGKDPKIMNLFGRPIAPLQDLFQYRAEDKNGFTIPLTYQKRELSDGDVISEIPGKPGRWKVSLDTNRYVWM
jgi:hypothetical protein